MNVPQTEDEIFVLTPCESEAERTETLRFPHKPSHAAAGRTGRGGEDVEPVQVRGNLWIGLCLGCLIGFYAAAIVAARAGGKVMGCVGILQ